MVVVRLVIFVPVVPRLDSVEVSRLAGSVLVVPPICLFPHKKMRKDKTS